MLATTRYRIVLLALCAVSAFGCDSQSEDDSEHVYTLQLLSGDEQSSAEGTPLPQSLVLRVVDESFRPQPNVELRALVKEGGGVITPTKAVTNEEGRVLLTWILGHDYVQSVKVWTLDQPSASVVAKATSLYRYEPPPEIGDGWPVGSLNVDNSKTQLIFDGIDEIRKGTYPEVHSLLIAQGGILLLEEYWPGHDSNGQFVAWDRSTPHEVQSASKSFRSMLVGIAIDKGFIDGVDTPVADFFPEFAHLMDGKQEMTLDHVLTMSSGLQWTEGQFPIDDPRNTLGTMYGMPSSKWVEYILSRPLANTPGTVWLYNTGASILVNQIIISRLDISFVAFVRDYYAKLVESATLPGVGNPLGAVTLPRDMTKFGQVYLADGKWKEMQIISKEWIDTSFEPRFQTSPGSFYGYQWWSRTLKTTRNLYLTYYAAGNGGQFVFVIRDLDLVVVSTGGNFGLSIMGQMIPFLESWVLRALE